MVFNQIPFRGLAAENVKPFVLVYVLDSVDDSLKLIDVSWGSLPLGSSKQTLVLCSPSTTVKAFIFFSSLDTENVTLASYNRE